MSAARAERRRAAAAERKLQQQWARGVTRFHEQALGAFTVEVIRPAQLLTTRPELAVPLTFGWYAQALAHPVAPLCLDCDTELRPPTAPGAWLLVSGAVEATGSGLITGVCKACAARDDAELLRIGLEPRRVSRRLRLLRGWSHGNQENSEELLA